MLDRSSSRFDEPYLNTSLPARNAKRRRNPVESRLPSRDRRLPQLRPFCIRDGTDRGIHVASWGFGGGLLYDPRSRPPCLFNRQTKELSVAKIRFIEHNGKQHDVEAANGTTVMNAAIDNLVPGIDADCGGECSCATCHVIVDDKWMAKVGRPGDQEESMLD